VTDNQTDAKLCVSVLASLAKPIRRFTIYYVTIPNNFVLVLPVVVDIVDTLLNSGMAPQKHRVLRGNTKWFTALLLPLHLLQHHLEIVLQQVEE